MKLFQPIALLLLLLLIFSPSSAQLMQGGMPPGLKQTPDKNPEEYIQVLAHNVGQFRQEDNTWDTIAEIPWRFGENIEMNISPAHGGTWQELADGARLWQTGIYSPGALSINLVFQPYQLPRGAKLFIYTPDGKQILGAFDHRNNQEDGYFATGLIFSDSIIVEYFEPARVAFEGKFAIEQLTHGYRHPGSFADKAFGDSGACNVNVACEVAEAYGIQIRSVALLLVGSNSFCTGALINNASNDGTPYILSANHCYRDPSTVVFWFNWESATCDNPDTPPPHQALSGALQRARYIYSHFNKTGSDFWLMEMNHLPPFEYNLFYSGWNRTEDPLVIDSVVGIHHPRGDIKKFSWSTDSLQVWGYGNANAGFDTHWRVKSWDAGTTTEGGSSGSPLFDHQGRIIGQLHGGLAACGNTDPDWYGRFSISWEGGGATTNALKTWLDPQDSNPWHINGYQPVYHLLEASVGENGGGTIDPSFYVMENRSHTFFVEPLPGFIIEDVKVDGVSVGAVDAYTFEIVTQEHTIHATFEINSYTLTATAGENGTITPAGEIVVEHGAMLTFTITPDAGYHIDDILVNDESVGAIESYTFENINQNHSIHATFSINTYTLTATASENGTITPAGEIIVEHGASHTFTITPDDGYHIEDVLINGESVGALHSYTFENITQNHTIHATFAVNTFTINATAGENGTINPEGEIIVEQGATQTFSINPDVGYHIEDVLVNGESLGAIESYTFENISQNHTLHVTFAINTYTLTATAGENGTIDPAGEISVEYGASQTFTITPDVGYHIEDVLVDGESVGAIESYTFENITQNHTIHTTFAISTFTITATALENGTINPAGEIIVEQGAFQTFTITPDVGYHIEDVLVDGESVGAIESYTFENIAQNHTIQATFAINTFQIVFEIEDDKGNAIEDALINLDGTNHEPGYYVFGGIIPGLYPYTVSREGYFSESGEVLVENQDITEKVILQTDDNSIPQVHPGGIKIYPNPATTSISIESPFPIHQIQLFTVSGNKVKELNLSTRITSLGIQELNTGMYILKVWTTEGISIHKIQIIR